jgi:signal transduction histidine kinase
MVQNAQLQQLSIELINLQDEERRRLARELHDSAIQMNLAALQRPDSELPTSTRSLVSDSVSLADRCSSEIRTMSYLLHPPFLAELGCAPRLRCMSRILRSAVGSELTWRSPKTWGDSQTKSRQRCFA